MYVCFFCSFKNLIVSWLSVILGCFHIMYLVFHPSLNVSTFLFCVCFFPSFFFLFSLLGFSFILGCFPIVCVWFAFFLYLLLGIHPSIHPLDVFTLCVFFFFPLFLFSLLGIHPSIFGCFHLVCACMFLFTFFNFASCLFSFILGCFSSIRLHLLLLPLLEDSTTAPPVLPLLVLSARKSWAKKFFGRSVF